ncbi:Arginine N-methyltransferase 2 [Scheffersomyces spartinae]|uniref:Arginine N-methyltransferase 2 n=1 Tax=Scheffersomyces spartinae TaxID=45513 RepID=A0A9P8AKP1_9ASCO|nr:Arginine N-methyltransferase 2 [Scheffersomyces spartinae]KAG7196142.1 Arginine N-methyltransferase 2 [Scheffersomyces spartinae]
MSDLHDLCHFTERPITKSYITTLRQYLKLGIPLTYTVEEAYNYTKGIETDPTSTTTPLHLVCRHYPEDATDDEIKIVEEFVSVLLEYGAGWCLVDDKGDTPGCTLVKRELRNSPIYRQIVESGVRAELLLRKVEEYQVEFIEEDQIESQTNETQPEEPEEHIETEAKDQEASTSKYSEKPDAACDQQTYLSTKLEYTDDALLTKDAKDGVMMDWETDLMHLGAQSLFKGGKLLDSESELDSEINVLNIGFGMGIIDTKIQELAAQSPSTVTHYICEAHPDVLLKMRKDGWYDKPNVVVLEGRWQDQLDDILQKGGVFFNGIYYDTFSEHYEDMLELFDYVVGLLKPHGVFSFFNGLGADRWVVYDVYRKLVELDLSNYGLSCVYTDVNIPNHTKKEDGSVWDDVKRSYFECPVYYHPEIRFIDI